MKTTDVKAHPRRGTRGVREHARQVGMGDECASCGHQRGSHFVRFDYRPMEGQPEFVGIGRGPCQMFGCDCRGFVETI